MITHLINGMLYFGVVLMFAFFVAAMAWLAWSVFDLWEGDRRTCTSCGRRYSYYSNHTCYRT